jgi:pimeloyl-ACP methyl ester carboxylesterase
VIVLGTGTLLPPLDGQDTKDGAAQQRLERRMATHEPTIEDTRKLLEANLFHHDLIAPGELALRHARSVGKNFEAFVMRNQAAEAAPPQAPEAPKTPLWQRLVDLKMPLLMIYGREDRSHAFERATLLKEKFPQLNLHIVSGCKHLVPWDAADEFQRRAVPFLRS